MSDLYDSDIVTWSEHQAGLLRRVAAGEARGFRAQARRRYKPSMRQKLDIEGLYNDALLALPETMDGQPPLKVPPACPVTLDDVITQV